MTTFFYGKEGSFWSRVLQKCRFWSLASVSTRLSASPNKDNALVKVIDGDVLLQWPLLLLLLIQPVISISLCWSRSLVTLCPWVQNIMTSRVHLLWLGFGKLQPAVKSGPLPVFVNKALLEPSQEHLFILESLWLLLTYWNPWVFPLLWIDQSPAKHIQVPGDG